MIELKSNNNETTIISNYDSVYGLQFKNMSNTNVCIELRWYSLAEITKLHKHLGEQIELQQQKENKMAFIDYTVEQFTDDLGHSLKGAGFSIPSDCSANLFNDLRKMLNYVQWLQAEIENIRTDYEYQKQGYDKALQENERLKSDNKTANSNYNTWADNAKKEIAGLKEKHNNLFNDNEVEKDNYTLMYNKLSRDYEKLKTENEERGSCLNKYTDLIKIIEPEKCSPFNYQKNFTLLESFIKKALAKERKYGYYVVQRKHSTEKQVAEFCPGHDAILNFQIIGCDYFVSKDEFSYISSTPINLEVGK